MGVGEATSPENMEALYEHLRSWGMGEEDSTTFMERNGIDE